MSWRKASAAQHAAKVLEVETIVRSIARRNLRSKGLYHVKNMIRGAERKIAQTEKKLVAFASAAGVTLDFGSGLNVSDLRSFIIDEPSGQGKTSESRRHRSDARPEKRSAQLAACILRRLAEMRQERSRACRSAFRLLKSLEAWSCFGKHTPCTAKRAAPRAEEKAEEGKNRTAMWLAGGVVEAATVVVVCFEGGKSSSAAAKPEWPAVPGQVVEADDHAEASEHAAMLAGGKEGDRAVSPGPIPTGGASSDCGACGGVRAALPAVTRAERGWRWTVLRGGAHDRQGLMGAAIPVGEGGTRVLRGEAGSELSTEACRALGVPIGSKWGVEHRPGLAAAADSASEVAGEANIFDVKDDDEALLQHVFLSMDKSHDKRISREELYDALNVLNANKELVDALLGVIKEGEAGIDFEAFRMGADQVGVRYRIRASNLWSLFGL